MTTTYKDIEITYDEYENKWTFTLRGKDRSTDSLKAAKEMIDAPPPRDKKAFTKTEVWHDGNLEQWVNDSKFVKVSVTSIAEPDYAKEPQVRCSQGKGRRTVRVKDLFYITPANDAKIDQIRVLREDIAKAEKQVEKLIQSLDRYELPKDVE